MKFKRFLSLLLALCLTLVMFPVTSSATEYWDAGSCGTNAHWALTEDGTLYITGTGSMDDYTYESAPWSAYRYDIRKVVISDGITGIGQCAFYALPNVTSISIPDSVTAIAYCGIAECTSLTSLTLPDRLESISEYALYQNSGLTGITVPDSVTEIAYYAFADCTGLKSIDLPQSLQYVGDYAFARCTSLTDITLPDSVVELTYGVLADCTSLKSIGLPESLQYIGDGALSGCSSLESITLPETVTAISYYALSDCTSLTEITLPQSLETISDYAFGWSGINTMTFTGDAPQIDANAFCDITADAWIPLDNDTWTEDVLCSYGGDITWLQEEPYVVCATPELTVTTNDSGKPVLSWDAVDGASKYEVQRSEDGENFTRLITTAKTEITNSSAEPGKTYYYKVKAIAENEKANSDFSDVKSVVCILSQPELTVTTDDSGNPVLSWDAVKGASKYEVQRSEDGENWTRLIATTKTEITNSSAEPGKTYYYKVKAIAENTDANSDFSDAKSVVCILSQPELTVTTNDSGKPVLSWDAVKGAEKYEVQRSEDGKTFTRLITTAKTEITNSSAEPGKTYYYKVKAIAENTEANSPFSDAKSVVCILTQPELTVTTNDSGKPVLSWDAVKGASKYEVQRSEDGKTFTRLITTAKTEITNSSAEPGKTYYYKVKAIAENTEANSPFSDVKSVVCVLTQPELTVTTDDSGKPVLSWDAVDGAEKYEVHWSTNGKTFTRLITTAKTEITNSSAEPGKTYYYKVKAIAKNTDANSPFSDVKSVLCALARPSVKLTRVSATGKIKISWAKVTGAKSYTVYRSTNGKSWSKLKNTDSLSYTDKTAEPGKTYYYKVKAIAKNTDANSAFSAAKKLTCGLAQPKLSLSTVASTGKIKLSWAKVTGAKNYEIYRSTNGKSWSKIRTTGSLNYIDKAAEPGKTYYYKVRALNSTGKLFSEYADVKSTVATLAQPEISLSNVAATGKIKITWTKISGAKNYEVYRSTDGGKSYKLLKTVRGTSLTDSSGKAGKTYYYQVVAVAKNEKANSAPSEEQSKVCDLARPNVTLSRSSGKPKLKWNKVSGAKQYVIYRSTNGKTWSKIKTTTSLSYLDTGAKAGKTYYYRVVAIASNSAANSAKFTTGSIKSR